MKLKCVCNGFDGIAKRKHKIIRLFLMTVAITFTGVYSVSAQNYQLGGTLIDQADKQPVIGAFVTVSDLKDSTDRISGTSDVNGKFLLTGLKKQQYKLTIQSISYSKLIQTITIAKLLTDMGTIGLAMESKVLNEVVVMGQGTAIQKGDTTIMSADAFKVNPDANAEDLVKKMPGITVENGTVKARGEDVTKVLVDGKPFFGDDPSVALRNLPADVIDRVQVYNKLSDQAELTGFDDGNSSHTINIITRKDAKMSTFGKFTGGTNFTDKYLLAGNLNIFKGPRRFTFTGMTNNVNMANFAMQDLLGSTGSGGGGRGYHNHMGGMGGGGFFGSSGINENTSSFGMNYTDNWGKKIVITGSYFFNTSTNNTIVESNTEYLFIEEGKYATTNSDATTSNYNHRVNFRVEYTIDSMNSIIIVPRLSLQDNSNDNYTLYSTSGGGLYSETMNSILSDASAYSFGNEMTWRHKFIKKGRTLSIRSYITQNKRSNEDTQIATTDSVPDNQWIDGIANSFQANTRFSYTEPIGKNSQLQFNYTNNFTRSETDKETFGMGSAAEIYGRLDSLSNVFDNDYVTNEAGLAWLYKKKDLSLSAEMEYQRAVLTGHQTYPTEALVDKTFQNFLPSVRLTYKISDLTNLRLFYRTDTDAPTVTELQNVIDNSNRLSLSTGNPDLKQEYTHNIMSNFSYANPTTGFNTFVFFTGNYISDVVSNRTIYAKGDTLEVPAYDVTLLPGGQLTYPVNLDRSYSLRTMVNFSYFIKPIKSNLSLIMGASYTQAPGYIDSLLNRSGSYNLTNSLILTSNISSNLDFTLSYTSNYQFVKNSANVEDIIDSKYWYQSASAKINWIIWKGFVLNTDALYQSNHGLSADYNDGYFVWNASFGKKFLKNQAAELKLGVYDILNQSDNVTHTVTASTIRDTRTNTYQRYFLVLFTYNLRSKRGVPPTKPNQQEEHHGPPGGMPPGMRPPGMPPGSMPPGGKPHDH